MITNEIHILFHFQMDDMRWIQNVRQVEKILKETSVRTLTGNKTFLI